MSVNSVLAIERRGSYVKKAGNRFVVQNNGEKKEYSADKVSQLLFLAPAAISSEAVRLAVEKNVDIVYLDWRGKSRISDGYGSARASCWT